MLNIRPLNDEDTQLVLRLKTQAGWNQTPSDVVRFRQLSPEGSFVAQWDDSPVGCVMVFEFGAVAWIAMMLVDEAFRGRGIGRALMDRALEHTDARGIASVRLDATSLGQPLYEKLGFVPQFQVARYGGIPQSPTMPAEEIASTGVLLPASEEQYEEILELDQAAVGADRRGLLLALLTEHPDEVRVVLHERRIRGYITSRPGANARQIGPCIAAANQGQRLLEDALERHVGESVFMDIPADNREATAVAAAHGLSVQRTLMRMCRGAAAMEDVTRLFASSSPEKG